MLVTRSPSSWNSLESFSWKNLTIFSEMRTPFFFHPFQAQLQTVLVFCRFWSDLEVWRKQLLHFRGCICLKATLCYVNTLRNWEMPSCIYSRTCYTFRYYLKKLWLPLCELPQTLMALFSWQPGLQAGRESQTKMKVWEAVFPCCNTRTWTEWKSCCVCISSYCLCRTERLQMLQTLLTSSCPDS